MYRRFAKKSLQLTCEKSEIIVNYYMTQSDGHMIIDTSKCIFNPFYFVNLTVKFMLKMEKEGIVHRTAVVVKLNNMMQQDGFTFQMNM